MQCAPAPFSTAAIGLPDRDMAQSSTSAVASRGRDPRIALALGGGGARGLAHVPVLEAFDELGVKPCHIAGTSIGALIGVGFAAGMSGAEIREHIVEVIGDGSAVLNTLWGLRPKTFTDLLQGGLFRRAPLDPAALVAAVLPAALPARFEQLALPLSVIATDFYGHKEVVFGTGELRPAIAASIALPMLFRPVVIDDKVLIDGGAVAPLPFDHVGEADITVAVDVMGGPQPREDRVTPTGAEAMFGAMQLLMQAIVREKLKTRRPDVLIAPEVNRFRLLDFFRARQVLEAASPIKETAKREIAEALDRWARGGAAG
jgi:NTE family protein